MPLPFNTDLQITEGTYNDNHYSSVKNLAKLRLSKPDLMNSFITYAYGSGNNFSSKNFPLLFALAGKGNKRAIKSNAGDYQTWMYGKPRKTDSVARVIPGQVKAGQRSAFFKIAFKSKFFMNNEVITAGGVQKSVTAQVHGPLVRVGGVGGSGYWEATCKLVGVSGNAYCPEEFLKPGAIWAGGVVKVGLERSKGTEQRQPQTPFIIQNQLSLIRRSFNYAGNVSNKVLSMPFKVDGKMIDVWTEWEMYLNELQFNQAKNEDLIFSEYNKAKDGSIGNIDADTGEVVPMGMGLWGQIPHELNYTRLTEQKINDFISIMLDNNEIGGNQETGDYTIVGGTGLLEEVDAALKRSSSRFLTLSDKFVRGEDKMNLQYGAYFTEFRHSSGKIIKFVYDRSFDFGAKAQTAPRHPLNPKRSIMSYCGMALNFSLVDVGTDINKSGQESNITMVYEEGREYKEWFVLGGADVPHADLKNMLSRASDVDASSHHIMCSQGVNVTYPGSCGKLICNIS